MKLHTLARELGLENKTLSAFLDGAHHMSNVTEEQEKNARSAYAGGVLKESIERTNTKVKFWSTVRELKIADGYDIIKFKDYLFITEGDSHDADVVRAAIKGNPDIKEVVDEPYEDDGDSATFRKLLHGLVFTGAMREVSRERGMTAVRSLFWPSELDTVSGPQNTPDRLIERAVKYKSFKG